MACVSIVLILGDVPAFHGKCLNYFNFTLFIDFLFE